MAKSEKKDKRLILLVVAVIAVLLIVNIIVFTRGPSSIYCYKNVCLIGERDPIEEIKILANSSKKVILVVEGDKDPTQKSAYVSNALISLASDFAGMDKQIVGIKFSNKQPIECICSNFNQENFTDCQNSTEYCESLSPAENEIMLKVYYPDFNKNEIIVEGRTIKFHAKSGADAYAMVVFFNELFADVVK